MTNIILFISIICNFRPQLLILGCQLTPLTWPSRAPVFFLSGHTPYTADNAEQNERVFRCVLEQRLCSGGGTVLT